MVAATVLVVLGHSDRVPRAYVRVFAVMCSNLRRSSLMWDGLVILPKEARSTGITRQGRRCSITSSSRMTDQHGRCVSEPLRNGCDRCLLHMDFLKVCAGTHLPDQGGLVFFYLDFESTGLDIFSDQLSYIIG